MYEIKYSMYKVILIMCYCMYAFKKHVCAMDIWHSYQIGSGAGNREELIVKNVTSDPNFNWGENVTRWESIEADGKNYAVGLRKVGFTILSFAKQSNSNYFTITSKDNDLNVSDIKLIAHFNEEQKRTDVIIILATPNLQLKWYKLEENLNLVQMWTWVLHRSLVHMNTFRMFDKNLLLVINDKMENYTTADLYQFKFQRNVPDIWLLQTITLDCPAKSSALNTYAMDGYLIIPQEKIESVLIFKYSQNRFVPYFELKNISVQYVNSFTIGFKSFLTVSGKNAGIYALSKEGPIKQEIADHNLEEIHYWFPVSVKTYRDAVVLIAQRNLDHQTHTTPGLEIVLYDGRKFVVHDEIPCYYHGEIEYGLTCITDEEMDQGVIGSAVISMENTLSVLVPRKDAASALFSMHTEMRPVQGPVNMQAQHLLDMRDEIEVKLSRQIEKLQFINNRLKNSLKLDGENIITAPWKIHELSVPSMKVKNPVNWLETEETTSDELNFHSLVRKVSNATREIEKLEDTLRQDTSADIVVKKLIITDKLEVKGIAQVNHIIVQTINNLSVHDVFEDIVRLDKIGTILQNMTFKSIKCENITFSSVNNIDAKNIARISANITIESDVVFKKQVHIAEHINLFNGGKVNSKILHEDVIETDRAHNISISFESLNISNSLNVDTINKISIVHKPKQLKFVNVTIPRNVTAEKVNGMNFTKFLSRICLKELYCYIPGEISITGYIDVEKGGLVHNLNRISFPNGFLFTTNRSESTPTSNYREITGKKIFLNTVKASEAIVKHGIEEIHTMGHVDLISNQLDLGNITFYNLELIESLDVGNETYGAYIEHFLPNPTLTESNNIKSQVIFQNVEVEGKIIVEESFNGSSLESLLGNVVYKDQDNITINSIKEFPMGMTIQNGLNIVSNIINKIPISLFVRKDIEQELMGGTINGNVIFENLYVQGVYDEVNITEVDQESVKLSGQQFITSTLEFINPELFANELEIKKTLNEQVSADLLDASNVVFTDIADFAHIGADIVIVNGRLSGDAINFDISDIKNRALSLSRDQNITANYVIENCKVKLASFDFMNGDYWFSSTPNQLNNSENMLSYLEKGDLLIKEIFVNGSLDVNYINDKNVKEIVSIPINTKNLNTIPENALSLNNAWFENLEIENLNGVNFNEFVKNVVFKGETHIFLEGEKIFLNGFKVNGDIVTDALNGVPLEELLTPSNVFEKPVMIKGNLIVNSQVNVGYLNGVFVDNIGELFQSLDSNTYMLRGDAWFERLAYIERLYVEGNRNGVPVNEFMNSIVYKNNPNILIGSTRFDDQVEIESNLDIFSTVNDLDLSTFLSEIVLTKTDAEINGVVFFEKPVVVQNALDVDTYLDADSVAEVDIQEWKQNAVYLGAERIPGGVTFAKAFMLGNVEVEYLNGIDFLTYIPLNSDQVIPVPLSFEKLNVESDVSVGKTVNGLILEAEYSNTLMREVPQEIRSKIIFTENVVIEGNLQIDNTLNKNNVKSIVTTNLNQNLTANYVFHEISLLGANLLNVGLVNNVNTTLWHDRVFLKKQNNIQNVTGNWKIKDVTFVGDVISPGLVGNLNLRNVSNEVTTQIASNTAMTSFLMNKYQTICNDVQKLWQISKEQTYLFRYFDFVQTLLEAETDIQNIHFFKNRGSDYLLVNLVDNCNALMYRWSGEIFYFIGEVPTGMVEQFITVFNPEGQLFLVSRSNSYDDDGECDVTGTNIWIFEDDLLMHIGTIAPAEILQDSIKPSTFYTLGNRIVLEYNMIANHDILYNIVRRWFVQGDNLAFVPRGANAGLCLRDGTRIMKLFSAYPPYTVENDYMETMNTHNVEFIENGNYTLDYNQYFPGADKGDILAIPVRNSFGSKNLVAVASHEETSVKGPLDFIRIYENIMDGVLFHKVPANNPSSLVTMSFGNGETLLIFLEDEKLLSIYEYKGMEGFKLRNSIRIQATKIQPINISMRQSQSELSALVIINGKSVSILKAVMAGNPVNIDYVDCTLLPPV